ncbi:NAD(P)H-dependent oxidoreductase [Sphingobacterium hungaricum]|uniref:NAD(P)H oxidoreductase n=1 Tax=Sphingobacterium hungaricum TaxID=2082723 RepID=A0A928UUN3_9SPHI|nr:NAD(P)H-dependent oxidoreductase [Sphingobacterium hungaricum]MBE8713047.1 NAD(P)H oxidoreductase [Sphingobacterium hungaricum]
MKTLIIVTHPNLQQSVVNKRWLEEIGKFPEKFTIHNLYKTYPDQKIDVLAEQELIENHDKIIFQFPFYWFSSPPLLKQWLDEVLTYGWAYGSKSGYKLEGKKIALAISVGGAEEEYRDAEKYGQSLETLTYPLKLSFDYVKADYQPLFASYGFEINAEKEVVDKSADDYLDYLNKF